MEKSERTIPQARTKDLVTRELSDEVLVYDMKRHKAHCLNQTAALVWKHCDGKKAVTDIAAMIEKELNTTVGEAAVWLAVEQLGKASLLESRIARPIEMSGVSRRQAMRKLGSALAIPMVMSIVAPSALAASTCVGLPCTGEVDLSSCGCADGCCSGTMMSPSGVCLQNGLAPGAMCVADCQCNSTKCSMGTACK